MDNIKRILEATWLLIKGLLWPLFKSLFMFDYIVEHGIYIFIFLIIYGGLMTCSEKRKLSHIAEMLAGIIGTIYLLITN